MTQNFAPKVDILSYSDRIVNWQAEVAELADALRSGRSEHYAREGSNPSFGTQDSQKTAGLCLVTIHSIV